MADTTFPVTWGTTTALDVTNLHSLADGNIWGSEAVVAGNPAPPILQISYSLVTNAVMVAQEFIAVWVFSSDGEATTPYYPANVASSQGVITTGTTPNIATVLAARNQPHDIYSWQTSHGTLFQKRFLVFYPGTAWKVMVRPVGEALASSGNVVRYRYGTPTGVSA